MDYIKGSLYTFTTDRQIAFHDKKLGIFYKLIQCVIFCFILYDLFTKQLYFKTEVPSGYTTMWAEVNDLYNIQRNTTVKTPKYCDNKDYDYIYSLPYWDYRNSSCINLHYSEMYEKGENEFFFQTYFTENKIILQDCDHFNYTDSECQIMDRLDGQCFCQNYKNFYSIGVEGMQLAFNHLYSTSFESGSNLNTSSNIRPIKTIINNHDKTKSLEFKKGENIVISIKDWLELSGIDLEDYNKDVKVSVIDENIKNNTYPIYRITGLEIILNVNYYNIKDLSTFDEAVCIIDVVTNKGWASKGSNINYINYPNLIDGNKNEKNVYVDRYRFGIKFKIIVSGLMGKFDFYMLINHLVSVIVLTGTARSVVSFIIMYFLGRKSTLFKKHRVKNVESDKFKLEQIKKKQSKFIINNNNNINDEDCDIMESQIRYRGNRKERGSLSESCSSSSSSDLYIISSNEENSDNDIDIDIKLDKNRYKEFEKDFTTLDKQFSGFK